MTDQNLATALSDAAIWQADARSRPADPPTAEQLDRARLEQLGQTCPAARLAGALLGAGWAPLPLDADTGEPSSKPLDTPGAVWQHYRHRNADGAGLALGTKPGGVSLVAVHGTAIAWQELMAEHAIVERRDHDDGRTVEDRFYRDTGRPVSISWQPPATAVRSSGVAFGPDELNAAAERMRPRPVSAEPGWLVWAVAPDETGRTVSFRNRKLGAGLSVLADGVVPVAARRDDGWALYASGVPLTEAMPGWLVDALGGRWKARAAT